MSSRNLCSCSGQVIASNAINSFPFTALHVHFIPESVDDMIPLDTAQGCVQNLSFLRVRLPRLPSGMEVCGAGVNETMFLARFLCRSVTYPQEEPRQCVSRNVCHWTPCAHACAPRKAVTSREEVVQSVRYRFASFSQTRDNSYSYVCNGHSLCQGPHRRK